MSEEELTSISRRFWVTLFISIPIYMVAIINNLLQAYLPNDISILYVQWFLFIVTTPIVLWGGWPFFIRGYLSIKTLNLNIFTLITLGLSSLYIYNIFALLTQTQDKFIYTYFEVSPAITTLVLLAQMLKLKTKNKTTYAMKTFLNMSPSLAHLVDKNSNEEDVELDTIKVGNILRIKPYERIPVDGIVIGGHSNVDESSITGEAMQSSKSVDDFLIGATLNKDGTLLMRVVRIQSETILSKIVDMLKQVQHSNDNLQKRADIISNYFIPAVIVLAFFTFSGWMLWGPEPKLTYAVVSAVTVLIITFPFALRLTLPVSSIVTIGKAALMGILIKDTQSLKTIQKVTTLVVNKKETLTQSIPIISNSIISDGFNEVDILKYAASLQSVSQNPLAQAMVNHAKKIGLVLSNVEKFKAIPGKGIVGKIDNKKIAIGSEQFINSLCILEKEARREVKEFHREGKNTILMSIDFHLAAIFVLDNPLKESSKDAVNALKNQGLKIVLLSSDNEIITNSIANKLGIDKVHANVLADKKATIIEKLQEEGEIVAMASSSIDDISGLTQADVGIHVGNGNDINLDNTDITLIKGNLTGIVKIKNLSISTSKNIKQALLVSVFYNSIGIPITLGLFFALLSNVLLTSFILTMGISIIALSIITDTLRLKQMDIA